MLRATLLPIALFFAGVLNAQDYFPIEPGKKWTYGNVRSEAPNMTMFIGENKVDWEGEEYLQMKTLTVVDSSDQKSVPSVLLRKGKKGDLFGINLAISEDEFLFLPGKPEVGFSWTGLSGLSRINKVDATLSTPEGDFENCVVVESIAGTAKAYTYYQEGKGMVGMTIEDRLLMYLIE